MNKFPNFEIPIPKSPMKIKEWTDKISAPYEEKNMNHAGEVAKTN